jgi:hypothetical protein
MNYINGLSGINQLGALPGYYSKLIRQNRGSLDKVLKRADKLNGLGRLPMAQKKMLSFSDVVRLYNAGISDDEIKAWVWYRRSIGIPMHGWEKYYIDSSGGNKENILVTKKETLIKDNHFRDLKYVPAGTVLGKRINKTHKYDTTTYQFFRDNEGIKMVNAQDAHDSQGSFTTDPKKLDELVKKNALFYLGGELLPYPVYAYGNMYDRELELEKDKDEIIKRYGITVFQNHQKVVRESKPEFLSITNPDTSQRPKILSISKFAMNKEDGIDARIEELRAETGLVLDGKTPLFSAFKLYLRSLDRSEFEESTAYNIIYYYLDNHNAPRDSKPEEKAELKRTTRNEAERLFDKFLHEGLSFEDQQRLDFIWNRMYNGQSNVAHHKIPIGFEASSRFQNFDFELRPAQREGIAFMELTGSGIIAYDVGVGKTITAIAEIANSLHSGKCKRPLIIVPNPTYKKWLREIIGENDDKGEFVEGMLAGTGIKVNDWYNLGTTYPRKVLEVEVIKGNQQIVYKPDKNVDFSKTIPEKTITIVSYEGFKKIGFGDQVADELFVEMVNILHQSSVDKSARDNEIEYQKYREKIGVGLKDTVADIDALGFDYIVIDEAHNCKNIFSGVKKNDEGQKRFGMTGAVSDTGIKAFFLTNYLQRKYGRNVLLLTATPFTNSPLEIYSMLSLVAYQGLHDMKIYNINDFFERHVLETTEDVVNYKEEIVQKDVVKSFNNRLLLQKLIYNHINYKTGDEAGVRRPCKINLPKVNEVKDGILKKLPPNKQILTYLRMTDRQRSNQNAILQFARMATAKGGEILKAMNFSLNNAFHPALYDRIPPEGYKDFVDESPKIKYTIGCVKSVKKYHEDRNEHVSGQVIYSNRGKDYFPYIKEYLEKVVGYKKDVKWNRVKVDEVEIIDSSVNQTKKENIKEAFLDGICKIIIGTATIREGIDLQKKGTVIYSLYPDWNPTDIRQLEGRVWRQKNEYGYVRVVMPLVQDSMDVFIFQKLEEKTSRINDIWYRGDRGNVLDLESLDPEEVKFALLTDVTAIAATILKKEIKIQERKINIIGGNISTLRDFKSRYTQYENYKRRLEEAIWGKVQQMQDFEYIKSKPTEEKLEKLDKDNREKIKKDIALFDEINKFLGKTPYEDKELLMIARKLQHRFDYFETYTVNYFKESLAIVKKAERTILASKGYTVDDDIDKVIKDYEKDLQKEKENLEELQSDKHKREVEKGVQEKKSAMKITGKSIEERVEEFKSLNHLLSYKFADIDPQVCIIPDVEKSPETVQKDDGKEKRIRLARVKAQAKLKLLHLMEI